MEYENWLTRGQVAKELNISSDYVQILTKNGRLKYVVSPLGRIYNPASVAAAKAAGVGHIRKRLDRAS
jgi:hypothetical protein